MPEEYSQLPQVVRQANGWLDLRQSQCQTSREYLRHQVANEAIAWGIAMSVAAKLENIGPTPIRDMGYRVAMSPRTPNGFPSHIPVEDAPAEYRYSFGRRGDPDGRTGRPHRPK